MAEAPNARLVAKPTRGIVPVTVQFSDLSSAGESPIAERQWDFGDGSESTTENPVHEYVEAGNFEAVLSVRNSAGVSEDRRRIDVYTLRGAMAELLERFEEVDAQDDGVLTLNEVAALLPDIEDSEFQAVDADGNQVISLSELIQFVSDGVGEGERGNEGERPREGEGEGGVEGEDSMEGEGRGDGEDPIEGEGEGGVEGEDPVGGEGESNAAMVLTRTVLSPLPAEPGALLEIQLDISYLGEKTVNALGVAESLPEGWAFLGVRGTNKPDFVRQRPETNTIDMVWLTVGPFPRTFMYDLQVPQDSSGDHQIRGVGLYRLDGPELRTEEEVSEIEVNP